MAGILNYSTLQSKKMRDNWQKSSMCILYGFIYVIKQSQVFDAFEPRCLISFSILPSTEGQSRKKRNTKIVFPCYSNIQNACGANSCEDATVHPSPREMLVSSPNVVWNHMQSLHNTLLYGSTLHSAEQSWKNKS